MNKLSHMEGLGHWAWAKLILFLGSYCFHIIYSMLLGWIASICHPDPLSSAQISWPISTTPIPRSYIWVRLLQSTGEKPKGKRRWQLEHLLFQLSFKGNSCNSGPKVIASFKVKTLSVIVVMIPSLTPSGLRLVMIPPHYPWMLHYSFCFHNMLPNML